MKNNNELKPEVKGFLDQASNTVTYVVKDPQSDTCAIIDSVMDFDPASGKMENRSADAVLAYISEQDLTVQWILETHVHADHLSAAPYLKIRTGAKLGVGSRINEVQNAFGRVFNSLGDFDAGQAYFDRTFAENDTFQIGSLPVRVIHTPGHTPACVTYVIGDSAFVGDTLFMPDFGTARTDFPGGDASQLYLSIRKILSLDPSTRLFMCHDYKAKGRDEFCWETTVAEQNKLNIHIHQDVSLEDFVAFRMERDSQLSMPTLLLPSVQVNIRAGELPDEEDNGIQYLKIPVNQF